MKKLNFPLKGPATFKFWEMKLLLLLTTKKLICKNLQVSMKAFFLVVFFSLLCKANLLMGPKDGHGDKGITHLKHKDVTFGRDGAVLCLYQKLTLQKQGFIHSDQAITSSELCPVSALRSHMLSNPAAPPPKDPLFSLYNYKGNRPICFKAANVFMKCCIEFLYLDKNSFSMHSLNRDGAAFAFRAGAPAEFIKSQGD